jgi:hypothetical protein
LRLLAAMPELAAKRLKRCKSGEDDEDVGDE